MNRDQNAFRILVDSYSGYAFSVAFRIVNDEEESKDIVQETFLTVWDRIEHFNPEKKFSNWLYRIVVNKCLDFLRKKKRRSLEYPDSYNWNVPDLFAESNPESQVRISRQ